MILSDEENQLYTSQLEALVFKESVTPEEEKQINLLMTLIKEYEAKHYLLEDAQGSTR